jgi:hypothetical protein
MTGGGADMYVQRDEAGPVARDTKGTGRILHKRMGARACSAGWTTFAALSFPFSEDKT